MGRRCCITGCNSTSRLPEHHGVTYHSFPLDPTIRSVWIRNTRLSSDRQITKSVLVCSRHFRRIDFQPQRSGKYLLKQRVFPTVFPWGKVDPAQVEADLQDLKATGQQASSSNSHSQPAAAIEDTTKATVEAKVAQIMAETAELNAAGGFKTSDNEPQEGGDDQGETTAAMTSSSPAAVKFEAVTSFNPGARLEAQDFDGLWHAARVVEVDNDDREVLIKFERTGKTKSAVVGTEEWIPMNSTRLRQKISTKPIPVFELEEKCMARWSGPRKFPGTVKKLLGNDMYEVLFDDGYIKNVRAIHMNKVPPMAELMATEPEVRDVAAVATTAAAPPVVTSPVSPVAVLLPVTPTQAKTPKRESPTAPAGGSTAKKRAAPGTRKDWPLLDLSKLNLASLNLPEIPRDGEWTCHWVNDQPIGREGFLIVGEHRKPTVIVDDWRLPPGWVKHMYQRSNVLGKWDVILVTPSGKRFRSKSDLKVFLEEQGQVYNPDIYDFSIHRRRAKDINAYAFTPDYTPQQAVKPKPPVDTEPVADLSAPVDTTTTGTPIVSSSTRYIDTPVATPVPPMELLTTAAAESPVFAGAENMEAIATTSAPSTPVTGDSNLTVEDGYAYIGGLKVQIIDNLFRCPQVGCLKNFRKENHLQIHVKHYHQDLIKLLGSCPKMQELAEKRTHTIKPDQNEPTPKNQIPNQQFFAKLHQQDLQQTRSHRRSMGTPSSANTSGISEADIKTEPDVKLEGVDVEESIDTIPPVINDLSLNITTASSSVMELSLASSPADESAIADSSGIPAKRSRFSTSKRPQGSRKSNRQRTTRRYLTAAQATSGAPISLPPVITADSSTFGVSDYEETRHSFNATPDAKIVVVSDAKKRKSSAAPATHLSSLDSPVTADSGSSSFQPLQAPSSNEADTTGTGAGAAQPQYIKENGELIKIVRMRQEEIINCLCSYGEEDGLMIQCELCLCWQHGVCNGIDKEADVPDKYVCFICRNPQRGRDSMRFKHDQDWLYEGNLPVANYHIANPNLPKRFDFLNKSHILTGNLIEFKRFMHSLRVKINIGNNRCHPKLYLWAKKWDEDDASLKSEVKNEQEVKRETIDVELKTVDAKDKETLSNSSSITKKIKSELITPLRPMPNIPQPEAPIDPAECQYRLLEHIKVQQNCVMNRLISIEAEIDELEKQDELFDPKEADGTNKEILATFIKELDIMKQIAKLNALENTKQAMKQSASSVAIK